MIHTLIKPKGFRNVYIITNEFEFKKLISFVQRLPEHKDMSSTLNISMEVLLKKSLFDKKAAQYETLIWPELSDMRSVKIDNLVFEECGKNLYEPLNLEIEEEYILCNCFKSLKYGIEQKAKA
jgi:glutamate mutase epsilon subunit